MPNQATVSDITFYDIFAPQKVLILKIFDDNIAVDLWFEPPPIKHPGYDYEKDWASARPQE